MVDRCFSSWHVCVVSTSSIVVVVLDFASEQVAVRICDRVKTMRYMEIIQITIVPFIHHVFQWIFGFQESFFFISLLCVYISMWFDHLIFVFFLIPPYIFTTTVLNATRLIIQNFFVHFSSDVATISRFSNFKCPLDHFNFWICTKQNFLRRAGCKLCLQTSAITSRRPAQLSVNQNKTPHFDESLHRVGAKQCVIKLIIYKRSRDFNIPKVMFDDTFPIKSNIYLVFSMFINNLFSNFVSGHSDHNLTASWSAPFKSPAVCLQQRALPFPASHPSLVSHRLNDPQLSLTKVSTRRWSRCATHFSMMLHTICKRHPQEVCF